MNDPDLCAERACTAHASPAADFRVDGWLVQPALNRLVRGTTTIRVRPQLIDVLACLATRPGSVVSKSRLVTEVWSNRFIAESGISRCMAELRHVLEDDAKDPRIIETIPKRGYRLIATVNQVAAPEPAGTREPSPEAPPIPSAPASARCRPGMASAARGLLAAAAALGEIARHVGRRMAG